MLTKAPRSLSSEPANLAPELADLPLELLERRIEELAARMTAGCARWLELVAEFDRRTGWADTGCRSTAEWVAWRCSLTPRSAREHVRVARALGEVPIIRAAFERGELSYSKVRALTRIADQESEEKLLELARNATAAQLERMVRAARRVTANEADQTHRESYVRFCWDDDDGCLHVDAKLPPEEGAIFLQALDAGRAAIAEARAAERLEREQDRAGHGADSVGADGHPIRGSAAPLDGDADPPTPAQPTNAEALAAVAETALARPPSGLSGGERHQLLVHVDAKTLATDSPGGSIAGPGACAVHDGPGIAAETARRLACDCSLVPVATRDGRAVDIGRKTRSIPPAIRRALAVRDGRCQFPGCERHRFVDAHHIVHWARGGSTSLDNLILLCRHHHRLVHEGGYSVACDPSGTLRWSRPDGVAIGASPTPPACGSGVDAGGPAGPLLTGSGERMDLRSCVDAVLQIKAPAAP